MSDQTELLHDQVEKVNLKILLRDVLVRDAGASQLVFIILLVLLVIRKN